MARKKTDPSPVRLAVDNAEIVPPPAADDGGTGDGRSSRRSPPPPLPPDSPIIPIGMDGNLRFYLDQPRQLVALPVGKHTRLEIQGLYGEDAHLVHQHFPRYGKNGVVNGWDAAAAAELYLRHAAYKGIWSPTEKARGRGCWPSDSGNLMVNVGTAVLVDNRWQRPGLFGDYVMIAREAIMKPAPTPEPSGAGSAADEVLDLLATWNWRRPIDARLLLGWIVCSFLGAALPIRPVGWIIGPRNTGKSTLQLAIAGLAGGWLMSVLDPSPASIWQTLKYDCLAVGIDEAEPDADKENQRKLADLVRLARMCYSGGKLTRGSSDGEATEYALRSAVLFSSINTPPLLPQDRSRMILMQLAKLPKDQRTPDLSPERLRSLGARLLRRAIDGWPRLAAALEQYRIALKAVGHEGRSIEVFGLALAAADVVLSDHPLDSDSAAELAEQLDFASLPEAEDDLTDEHAWLAHLLSCVIPLDGVGGRNPIAAWLRQAVTGEQTPGLSLGDLTAVSTDAERMLGFYGIKIIRPKDGGRPEYFAIANRASGLERLHANSHWGSRSGAIGGWKSAARNLEGAHETTQRFDTGRGKGTAVPLKLIFPDGYKADVAGARAAMTVEAD
jgi:hypothetical protein